MSLSARALRPHRRASSSWLKPAARRCLRNRPPRRLAGLGGGLGWIRPPFCAPRSLTDTAGLYRRTEGASPAGARSGNKGRSGRSLTRPRPPRRPLRSTLVWPSPKACSLAPIRCAPAKQRRHCGQIILFETGAAQLRRCHNAPPRWGARRHRRPGPGHHNSHVASPGRQDALEGRRVVVGAGDGLERV